MHRGSYLAERGQLHLDFRVVIEKSFSSAMVFRYDGIVEHQLHLAAAS